MDQYDLFSAWFRIADWAACDLGKEGIEGIVLEPLGRHSKVSAFIVRAGAASSNFQHRKLVAALAGWIQEPPLELLAELFRLESERDQQLPKSDFGRFETQSVVEETVLSAARWVRREYTRPPAFELLRTIVERTMAGEYWNSASYAMTTLCRHRAQGSGELLNPFQQFATRAKVSHPSNPSLSQEKLYARNLMARNQEILDSIESLLNQKDEASRTVDLDDDSRTAIEELVAAAQRYDSA
jgi:hypothetical protein